MPLLETHSFLLLVARWHANRAEDTLDPDLQTFHRRAASTLLDALYPDETRPDTTAEQRLIAHWEGEAAEANRAPVIEDDYHDRKATPRAMAAPVQKKTPRRRPR